MARLDAWTGTDPAGEADAVAARIRARRGGELTDLDTMLLHAPTVADGWNGLLGAIRTRTRLPADLRELAMLRVAVLNGADYEWWAHEPVAREAGLTDAELAALAEPDQVGAALSGTRRTACEYTDAMTRGVDVDDALFAQVRALLDDREVTELTATVAAYNMVSRFLVALRVGAGDTEGVA
jgi:AhpD family alkylhydroperoxidase